MKTSITVALLSLWCLAHINAQNCPNDVIFVVDESEIMRSTSSQLNGQNGFERINDQIIRYLRAASTASSSGVSRAGYITIGMQSGRSAARQVIGLNSDLNLVSNQIRTTVPQNIGLIWSQIISSNLPSMIPSGSKVVIITATAPTAGEATAVSSVMRNLGSEVFVIGVPFASFGVSTSGLSRLTSSPSNVKNVLNFDDNVIYNDLQDFVNTACTVVDSDCKRCEYENGAGMIGDLNNCHRFYRCVYAAGEDQPMKYEFFCPWNTVWQQDIVTCVHETEDNMCAYCDAPNQNSKYALGTPEAPNCRLYRECRGDSPYEDKCCPQGQRFESGSQRCVTDGSCTDACGDDGADFDCYLHRTLDNICTYQVRQEGHPTYNMSCPAGSRFDQSACLCVALLESEACSTDARDINGCLWTAELHFSDGVNGLQTRGQNGISSGPAFSQSTWDSNLKVSVDAVAGEGTFRGGYLRSPYFSYRDFKPVVLMKLRFLEDSTSNQEQYLVSNVCCESPNDEPSVFVSFNPGTGQLRAGVKTSANGKAPGTNAAVNINLNVGQYRNQWKEVTIQVEGEQLKLKVDVVGTGFTQTAGPVAAPGVILTSKCTLKLGGPDHGGRGLFSGKMSEVFISNECQSLPAEVRI